MEKTIYKITCLKNNKVYIGQTKQELKKRFRQHCYAQDSVSLISRAIKKYGKNNFTITALYFGSDYNNMECYYIKQYNSQNSEFGYNILEGGQDPPLLLGDNCPFAKFDSEWFLDTVSLIKNTKDTFFEISNKQNCHESTISRINLGQIRKQQDWKYPLRNSRLNKQTVKQIQWFLINTKFHREELTEMFGCSISSIKAIRSGQNHYNELYQYPLGGSDIRLGLKYNNKINLLKTDLINMELSFKDIAKKYDISLLRLKYINDGKIYFEEDKFYPIRQTQEAVETIPLIGK